MSNKIFEDDSVVITKFVGPKKCIGFQITPKTSNYVMKMDKDRDFIQVIIYKE